jgi:2-phospho-L-lactate guanylyltransferase (CobY/MobA/RfbA family)
VAAWARTNGFLTIPELDGRGLNGAADAVVAEAARRHRPWAVIHADLPLVTPAALAPVFELAAAGAVLVPSHDGGTNVIAGSGTTFRFAYGRASFQRHLIAYPNSAVVTDARLALDLDTSRDLTRALAHPLGKWLVPLVG